MAFDEEDGAGIVQEFFACMDRVAQDFTAAFYALPDRAFDALMQCAISALSLQERYSLVAAVEVGEEEEGANQFTIVAWGLDGSAFGYSSASSI
jgi:hypothetical protein